MVDFHTHILPGIDDGSDSLETSLEMLQQLRRQGVEQVVATPHFYADRDRPESFLRARDAAEKILRQAMEQEAHLPQLRIGAEVYFFHGMSESSFLPQLTIRGSNAIMIELGPAPWGKSVYRELEQIYSRWGIVPVIAHIDRYISPLRDYGIPAQLEQLPVLVQANGSFFTRRFTAGMALKMLRKGQIHLLGSDCHDLHERKPDLGDALQVISRRLGQETIERIRQQSLHLFTEMISDLE